MGLHFYFCKKLTKRNQARCTATNFSSQGQRSRSKVKVKGQGQSSRSFIRLTELTKTHYHEKLYLKIYSGCRQLSCGKIGILLLRSNSRSNVANIWSSLRVHCNIFVPSYINVINSFCAELIVYILYNRPKPHLCTCVLTMVVQMITIGLGLAVMFFYVLCTVWTLFYFWAIRSYDRQVEINTYLLVFHDDPGLRLAVFHDDPDTRRYTIPPTFPSAWSL